MPAPASAALPAFLRGLERRARTLVEAQCGDADQAAAIWTDTAATFADHAASAPVASWPVLFWGRLLGHPALATAVVPTSSPLAALGPGPRAALLLRLVAGLDPRPAAQVLGVSEPTYRFALQRALEQARASGIDADALRRLREAWQKQPPPAPPERAVFAPAMDVSARVEPVDAPRVDPAPRAAATEPEPMDAPAPPRHRTRWLLAGLAAVAAAIVAVSFWPTTAPPLARPVALAPAVVPPDAPPLVTHPDYALIAAAGDDALAHDLAFLSWVAATQAASDAPAAATAPATAPAAAAGAGATGGTP